MSQRLKHCNRVLAGFLCLALLVSSIAASPILVQSFSDPWIAYVNKCFYSMTSFSKADTGLTSANIKATAYLVGDDDICGKSWLANCPVHDLYAVDPDLKIDGISVNPLFLPQDNGEYLKTIKEDYFSKQPIKITDLIYSKPEGFQGTIREGCYFYVFDYDEEWVTVWDDGFQMWSINNGILGCGTGTDAYLETHPAGFYKIKRNLVWMDFALAENHPYKSKDEVPTAGTGVVTKLVNLRPVPDESEKVYTPVYALPRGTSVNVVSTELVASKADGSTNKYYKVSFNGSSAVQNNTVYYLAYKVPGVYYLDSRYLNFTKKGAKVDSSAIPGVITNVSSGETVYVYAQKDTNSEKVGVTTKSTELWMYPSESDENWTTVLFSGQKRYVRTKYITKGKWKVTDISGVKLADISNDKPVITWKTGTNNVDFNIRMVLKSSGKKEKTINYKNYKSNSFTVDRKYIDGISHGSVYVYVQANTKNGTKGKEQKAFISIAYPNTVPISTKSMTIGKNSIKFKYGPTSLQYATNKKFTNAKIVEKPEKKSGKKNGTTSYKRINVLKNLKKGKTYYLRIRRYKEYKTAAGTKRMSGGWSKAVKVKTKK